MQLSKFKELSCLFMDIKTGVLSLCEKLELVPPSDSASAPTVSLASTVVDERECLLDPNSFFLSSPYS